MTVPKRIFWTTLGMGGIAISTMMALLLWITAMTDQIAAAETRKRVQASIERDISQNELLTIDYAYWTAAWEWVESGDDETIYDNIGTGASDSDSFDLIYLVKADGTPTHAFVNDVYESNLEHFDADLAAEVLTSFGTPALEPYPTVQGLGLIDGEVAAIAAARVQPDDISGLVAEEMTIMIGASWLDASDIADTLMISTLALTGDGGTSLDAASTLILTGLAGDDLAQIHWTPPRPGRALLLNVAPAVGLLAVLIGIGSIIIGRVSAQQTAAFLKERVSARTDPETGLLNRSGMRDITESPDMQALFNAGEAAIIYVDLNGLKRLNDAHGHRIGDQAIIATANRLKAAVRKNDHIARFGGDEFVCLIADADAAGAALRVAGRIAELTDKDFHFRNESYPAKAAIGIATSAQAKSWDGLLNQADQAMYQAKREGQGQPVLYSSELSVAV